MRSANRPAKYHDVTIYGWHNRTTLSGPRRVAEQFRQRLASNLLTTLPARLMTAVKLAHPAPPVRHSLYSLSLPILSSIRLLPKDAIRRTNADWKWIHLVVGDSARRRPVRRQLTIGRFSVASTTSITLTVFYDALPSNASVHSRPNTNASPMIYVGSATTKACELPFLEWECQIPTV